MRNERVQIQLLMILASMWWKKQFYEILRGKKSLVQCSSTLHARVLILRIYSICRHIEDIGCLR